MPSKEYDFLVTLKKNVDKKVNIISQILLLIALCAFTYVGIRLYTISPIAAIKPFVVAAFIFCWALYCITSSKPKFYRLALLVAGVYFFFSPIGFSWVGFLYIIAGLLEKQAKFPQEIGFDKEGITVNSFPIKNYTWNELNNVVIKDNLLTIDFKNNKLYQKEIQDIVSKEMEAEFNAFCKARQNISLK